MHEVQPTPKTVPFWTKLALRMAVAVGIALSFGLRSKECATCTVRGPLEVTILHWRLFYLLGDESYRFDEHGVAAAYSETTGTACRHRWTHLLSTGLFPFPTVLGSPPTRRSAWEVDAIRVVASHDKTRARLVWEVLGSTDVPGEREHGLAALQTMLDLQQRGSFDFETWWQEDFLIRPN